MANSPTSSLVWKGVGTHLTQRSGVKTLYDTSSMVRGCHPGTGHTMVHESMTRGWEGQGERRIAVLTNTLMQMNGLVLYQILITKVSC